MPPRQQETPMRALPLLALALLACGEKEPVDSAEPDNDGDGYTVTDGDCDDNNDTIFPGAAEVCDDLDNDCDGEVDVGATDAGTFYADGDGDGFGAPDQPIEACAQPEGAAADGTDCDDNNHTLYPG
ncbi:MAG: putative metal-binding motif-containing protein, partial [Alphaproteobacteria bacterium]|nr:putative metal-binding motif-containing protein [Alphaproteobacteria bacterium]